MNITLPILQTALHRKIGSKNSVIHLLVPVQSVLLNITEENRLYLIIENNGNKICFTTKEEYILQGISLNN